MTFNKPLEPTPIGNVSPLARTTVFDWGIVGFFVGKNAVIKQTRKERK
jgi:hypothetical protein